MRVLVSTNAFFGHFTPLVPLAVELQERGHDVVVATEPAFAPAVQSHGLQHVGVGRDLTLDDMLAVLPDIFSVSPEDQDSYARPRVFVELRANNVVDDLLTFVNTWKPDLIVRESGEFAAWAIAEKLAIPHVTVNVGAPISTTQWHADTGPWFRDLGRHIGLDDLRADTLHRYALLSFEPAGYNDWSDTPTASVYRPAPVGPKQLADERVAALDERPAIYVTMGTEFYNAEVMTSVISALHNDEWNLVVTTGPQGDPDAIDPGAANVVVAKWLPQDALLDRVSLIVTHAGAGTVCGALVRGIPAVCLPQGADQFHHAQRVEEIGMGIFLATDRRTAADIVAAATRVLDDPGFRIRGNELAAATERLPGVAAAAAHVETLVPPS